MTDLKDVLDREASRVRSAPGGLDRLSRRARRRQRTRRVTAGLVGLAIAAGGSLFAYRALGAGESDSHAGSRPASDPPYARGLDLWPHPDPGDAESAVARIRAGDHAYAWQTNGTEVALRYATDVIGWDSVVVLDRSGDTYELLGCDLLPAIGCDAEDLARLTVAEALIRDGIGVWGVTNIELEKGIAPAPSPGATPPAPSPDPTGVQADAERIALAFARSRVSEHRPDLFLKGSAADAYHSNRGGLSLAADYLGFNVGGSEMLEGRRVRVWIGLVTEVTSEGCWQTIYERVIIASGKVVDARLEDVGSRECGTR